VLKCDHGHRKARLPIPNQPIFQLSVKHLLMIHICNNYCKFISLILVIYFHVLNSDLLVQFRCLPTTKLSWMSQCASRPHRLTFMLTKEHQPTHMKLDGLAWSISYETNVRYMDCLLR
jgi:hypothetical protein